MKPIPITIASPLEATFPPGTSGGGQQGSEVVVKVRGHRSALGEKKTGGKMSWEI